MSDFNRTEYYDLHGKRTEDISQARSKVIFRPHNFRFYVKKERKSFFGFGKKIIVSWEYHHTSSTFGSWMWPEGMPLRFDGEDNYDIAEAHAQKLNSSWRPGIDR